MKLLYYALVVLLCTTACTHKDDKEKILAHADEIEKQVLPLDTTVRTGVLSNGLTYYVCPNKEPKQRAYFRLVVKVGSLVEEENELGIAHFVEHMMFKGSKHFPSTTEVHGFLRRNGFPIGHDSNAHTEIEHTRYVLDGIPSDNKLLMDSCLLFLRDVAGDAFLRDADIESERNVIVEEWRYRYKGSSTYLDKQMLNGSLYANRFPIGDINIIRNCPPSVLRDFYKRWYQPHNMAVMVVGDIDASVIEKKIRTMFGDLKRGKSVVPPLPKIADTKAPKFYVLSEPTESLPYINVRFKVPHPGKKENLTVADVKGIKIQENLADIFADKNLNYLKNNYDAVNDFINEYRKVSYSNNNKFLSFSVITSEEDWEEATRLLLQQIEQRRRKGFKEEEIERCHSDISIYNDDYSAINFDAPYAVYSDDTIRNSAEWVDKLTAHFMGEDAITSAKSDAIARRYTADVCTKEDLNNTFRSLTDGQNMYINATFPLNAKLPKVARLKEIYNQVRNMTDEELESMEVTEPKPMKEIYLDSLKINPVPGTVKKTIVRNDSITEALLSNGVKVIFWKKKTKDSPICLKFERPGGYSFLSNKDFCYRDMFTDKGSFRKIIPHDGYEHTNGFARDWYDDIMFIPENNAKSLKHALKYLYVRLTPSEIDTCGFNKTRKKLIYQARIHATPCQQAADKVNNVFWAAPQRWQYPTPEEAKALNAKHFMELVREHSSNYNGSLLVIRGHYNIKDIMPAVLKYIGSLPSKPEPSHYKVWPADHYKATNTTIVEKYQNDIPKCETVLNYTWEVGYKYTPETYAHNDVLLGVLKNLLFQTIRVEHSDVYTPSLSIFEDPLPINRMRCAIWYSCNPKERVRIAKDIDHLMHQAAEGNLITQELIDGYIKERERTRGNDSYNDLNTFVNQELYGMPMDRYDLSYLRKVTPESLKKHLRNLLQKGNLQIGHFTTE